MNVEARDQPTWRLATILAVVAAAQLAADLTGFRSSGVRVNFVTLLVLWAALSLRQERRWARTALLVLNGIAFAFAVLFLLLADDAEAALWIGWAVILGAIEIVALAFTLPEEGVGLGLPERWRPWATSTALHAVILVTGLLGLLL